MADITVFPWKQNIHDGQHCVAIILVCEWDGITPIHSSVKPHWDLLILPKTINQNAPCEKRITWECCNIVQKQVISQLSYPSVDSTTWLNQNVIWGIISPNRVLYPMKVGCWMRLLVLQTSM